MASSVHVSAQRESDVYDRQIRLWGAEAQSKLTSARVLYVNVSGVTSEIIKNLVLAGIRASICDGRPYPEAMATTPCSFLSPNDGCEKVDVDNESQQKRVKRMTVASVMQPHVVELNPLLDECEIQESYPLSSIPDEYFSQFDIVIASKIGMRDAVRISSIVTESGNKFFLVDTFGWYGVSILSLGRDHVFRKEIGKDKLSDEMKIQPYTSMKEIAEKVLGDTRDRWYKSGPPKIWAMYRSILNYRDSEGESPSIEKAETFISKTKEFLRSADGIKDIEYWGSDQELKDLLTIASAEMSAVCAVLGGVIGNEVIKAISGKGEPANNVLLFDGIDGSCQNFTIA